MKRLARIVVTNRSEAVRLPKELQFSVSQVFIHRRGKHVVLSPRPSGWDAYLASGPAAPDDFMAEVDDVPLHERAAP